MYNLTINQLKTVGRKVFKIKLNGKKDNIVEKLQYYFNLQGNNKYNNAVIQTALNKTVAKTYTPIDTDGVIVLDQYLSLYNKFLYKYILGYDQLYKDYKTIIYQVDYSYLFNDQFNTMCKKRVLEFEKIIINSKGYEQLQQKRDNTYKCNYCGKEYDHDIGFCNNCRDSLFLKKDDYHLLKVTKINDNKSYKNITIPSEVINDIQNKQKIQKRNNEIRLLENSIKKLQENLAIEIERLDQLRNEL